MLSEMLSVTLRHAEHLK